MDFYPLFSEGSHLLAPDEPAQKTMARTIASTNPIVKFMSPSFLTPLLYIRGNPDSFLFPNGFAVRIST